MHILRSWIQWVHRTGLTVVCSPTPFLMDPGKKGQNLSRQRCTRATIYVWIPLHWIARGRISRSGWKEEFFCSPFKGLLSSLVWKDTATNRFFHCSRQRKIRFFRSCRGHVPVALLSFASFVFGKGQVWLRVVKSVWNWFFFFFFQEFSRCLCIINFFLSRSALVATLNLCSERFLLWLG